MPRLRSSTSILRTPPRKLLIQQPFSPKHNQSRGLAITPPSALLFSPTTYSTSATSVRLLLVLAGEFHKEGFDEAFEVTVHDAVDVGGLVVCAVVFHTAVVEHVAADL